MSKLSQLEFDFNVSNINFVCFCETWTNSNSYDTYHLPDHTLAAYYFRREHIRGGVAIYAHKKVEYLFIDLSKFCCEIDIEVCGLIWKVGNVSIFIVLCYRSPSGNFNNFIKLITDLLSFVYAKCNQIILCGDFNIHFEKDDVKAQNLLHLLSTYGLVDSVFEPTREQAIIDNVFTNLHGVVCNVQPCLVSDHHYIKVNCNLLNSSLERTVIKKYIRSFREDAMYEFEQALLNQEWPNFKLFANINDAFDCFYNIFMYYFNIFFPEKQITISNNNSNGREWISSAVKDSSAKLKDLYYLMLRYPALREIYSNAKREHNILIERTKQSYYSKKIFNADNKSKAAWTIISNYTGKKKKHSNISIEVDGVLLDDPVTIVEQFNNFFVREPHNVISQISNAPQHNLQSLNGNSYSSMCAYPYSEQELLSIFKQIKNKNSSGPDNVPSNLLRKVAGSLLVPMTQLINLSFEQGIFPSALKESAVLPIYKKKSPFDITNYRPISLTSSLSKVFEYAMLHRLEGHLSRNSIICNEQHGFRSHHSTITAIHGFIERVIMALDRGDCVASVFCDLSRAFDCVNHNLLISKLECYGIRGVVADWFRSYLSDRVQFVRVAFKVGDHIKDFTSSVLPVTIGVPQGSVLGPLLFVLFINDIIKFVNYSLFLYADDTTAAVSGSNYFQLEKDIKNVLSELSDWFSGNELRFNTDKTNFIVFRTPQSKTDIDLQINVNGSVLPSRQSSKFLGLFVDQNLSWVEHCDSIVKKLNSSCYLLRNLKSILSTGAVRSFYFSEVHSRISYAVEFWGLSTRSSDVFLAQKRIIRCMAGISSRESCRPFFKQFSILPLPSVYILEVLCHFFSDRHNHFRGSDFHDYETRGKNDYSIRCSRLNITKRAPSSMGIKLFNLLPSELKLQANGILFRKKLKSLLLQNCFYSVDEYMYVFCKSNPNN